MECTECGSGNILELKDNFEDLTEGQQADYIAENRENYFVCLDCNMEWLSAK